MASEAAPGINTSRREGGTQPQGKLSGGAIGRAGPLVYVALVVLACISFLPFVYMVATSLKTYGETITRNSAIPFDPRFWPQVPQWQNYVTAWRDGSLGRYFINSVVISAVTVFGILATSIPAAFAFSKLRFPGRDAVFAVLIATLITPETVLLIPNYLVVAKLGWINKLPALTVPFMASPFYIFLLRQFVNQVPNDLLESARMDGASHARSLVDIVAPLLGGPVFTVGFLGFTSAWNALQWPMVVTQTPKWRPITAGLMTFMNESSALIHLRMAGSVIALLPVVIVYLLAQRRITEAVTRSGLKG